MPIGWFPLAILAAFSLATAQIFQKRVVKEEEIDPIAFAIFFQAAIAAFGFLISLASGGFSVRSLSEIWPLLFLVIFFFGTSNLFYFKSTKETDISLVSLAMTTNPVWTLLGGIAFLGEGLSLTKILGMAAVLGAILFVSRKKGERIARGIVYALIASILVSAAFLLDRVVYVYFSSPWAYQSLSILTALFMATLRPSAVPKIRSVVSLKVLPYALAAPFFINLLGFFALSAYTAGGEVSRVILITRASTILVVLFGALFLGEKESLHKKFLAALIVVGGVFLIQF